MLTVEQEAPATFPRDISKARYIDAAEVATLVREGLKTRWPGRKFRVKTNRYAGGANVAILFPKDLDGDEVRAFRDTFNGQAFDGMIDYQYPLYHWLEPGAFASLAFDPGSQRCGGNHPEISYPPPSPAAELVQFGCWVFCYPDHDSTESDLHD